jgi:uncharacterized membrane protein
MISTVTTTTVTTISSAALAASLGLMAVIALIILLIQKEFLSAAKKPRARALSIALNIAIIPLLLGFAFIVIVKVVAILQ